MTPETSLSDRELMVSRLIEGPRDLVFEAFTEVRHLSRWWGPKGFTTTTRSFEFSEGGVWEFTVHGPDGTGDPTWEPLDRDPRPSEFKTKALRDRAVEEFGAHRRRT